MNIHAHKMIFAEVRCLGHERRLMKLTTQSSLLALAVTGFLTVMAIGPAVASQWFSSTPPDVATVTPAGNDPSPIQLAAAGKYRDGSYDGRAYDAYYGMVQVQATVQGGQLTSVKVLQFPNHSGTSRSINRQALPILKSEVLTAQTVRVNMISGATLTSRAYLRSLNGALKQAGG
jgi:uncharacterized protein with FMN-binding domain